MEHLLNFLQSPAVVAAIAFWIISAVAASMPDPRPDSSLAYIWLHNIAQFVVANISKVKFPNSIPPLEPPKQ